MRYLILILSVCIFLAPVQLQPCWTQKLTPIPEEVTNEAAKFANTTSGDPLTPIGFTWRSWQSCYLLTQGETRIYVDAHTGSVTRAIYPVNCSAPITITNLPIARKRVMDWLIRHNISLDGWILDKEKEYNRGSFNEYVFQWTKWRGNLQLPCIIKVTLGGSGLIHEFWHVEREPEISLVPSVTLPQAITLAHQALGTPAARVTQSHLKVWYGDDKKQQLWWVIKFGEQLTNLVILNAHTGEIVVKAHHGEEKMDRQTEKKIAQVLADLKNVTKIDILALKANSVVGGPLASPTSQAGAKVIGTIEKRKNPGEFQEWMDELKTTIQQEQAILATVNHIWFRLYSKSGEWVYHCSYHPVGDYFIVETKEPWPPSSATWPPKGAQRVNIFCKATGKFKRVVFKSIDPKARASLQKLYSTRLGSVSAFTARIITLLSILLLVGFLVAIVMFPRYYFRHRK